MALPPLDRGLFAADAELLPVPGVSPLRLRPGRALLLVEGADLHQHRTGLPPTRGAFVALSAMVTIGRDPAPVLLPLLSDRIGQRYRIGVVPLRFLITTPVEAQLLRRQFGFDMRTADIERRVGCRAEESACQRGSRPILRLRVRTDGRLQRSLPVIVFYSVREGQAFRMTMSNPDPGTTRIAPRAAMLEVSDDEAVADLPALRISASSWMGVSKIDSRWVADTDPDLLGSVPAPARPAPGDAAAGRFTVRLGRNEASPATWATPCRGRAARPPPPTSARCAGAITS